MRASLPLRLLAGLTLVAALVFAASRLMDLREAPPRMGRAAVILPSAAAPPSHAEAVKRIDAALAAEGDLEPVQGDQWVFHERVALKFLSRARLTGDYADYKSADDALARAFALAPPKTGPHLARAGLDFQLHRLARTEIDLDAIGRYAVPEGGVTLSEVEAIRGDLAFYRGAYREALGYYIKAEKMAPSVGITVRQAILYANTGAPEKALEFIDRAEHGSAFTTPQAAASLKLQRGVLLLKRGRWSEAEASFAKADRIFPGHWVIQQHQAQMRALRGDVAGAVRLYETIIARLPNPETMDALAALWRADGNFAQAARWSGHAASLWMERLKLFPEAAYAHAFEHELVFGDPARALALAKLNWRARPHGAAAVALGWALLANGRAADALGILTPLNASHWQSAEQYAATAQAHAMLGQSNDAADAREKALRLNPKIFDPRAAMIWFGH